jgi:DNA topoisomerase IA
VQTPTLAIIVERENKIKEFKAHELHEIIGTFRAAAGEYAGRWFDEAFQKSEGEIDRTKRLLARLQLNLSDAEERLDSKNGAATVAS